LENEVDKLPYRWTFRFPIVALPWALAATFVLLIGLFRNINLLVLLGYLMAALFFLNALAAAKRLRALRGQRRIAQPVYAGLPCAVSIQIRPARGVLLGLRIEDAGPSHKLSWFLERLAREGQSLRGQIVLPRRGRYCWGALLASSGYPFGLVYRSKELAPAEEVVVLPRLGRMHRGLFRRLVFGAASEPNQRRRRPRRHAAAQEQFHGLRPFRTGDNPRAVHWRTSARRGEWMVREFEDLPGENILMVLDPSVRAPNTDDFEAAVSLAATIIADWCGDGGRLTVVVGLGKPVVLDGQSASPRRRLLLEQLALVEPLPSAAALNLLPEHLTVPPSTVVVVAAGVSPFARSLRGVLHCPVAALDSTRLGDLDFYEPPPDMAR
jgi:uncharacterized protein (DUF58 family)